MNYILIVQEDVAEDLYESAFYYENRQKDLGRKFISDWEDTLELLIRNPLGFQKTQKTYRHISLKKFPSLIIYKVHKNEIFVSRLINANREPIKRYK